ncbi:hypothetical protein [Klebsiella pneumoniae]|nr:hypothetical protein [Klebsiella pneumoniae]
MKIVGKTMKNTIKKERLQEIAEDGFLKHGESKELARMALAAMGDEPHTDDELSNLLWYSQEATCHSDPNYYCEFQRLATPGFIAWIIRELQERRKADMNSEPYGFTDGDRRGMIYKPEHADRLNEPLPVYRHAQPASLVPEDVRQALSKMDDEIIAELDTEESDCRAAMLQERQKSAGVSNNCRSNENVQVMQDVSRCSTKAAPVLDSSPKTAESCCSKSPMWIGVDWAKGFEPGNSPVIPGCDGAELMPSTGEVIDPASGPDRSVEVRYFAPPGYVMVPKEPTAEMIWAAKYAMPSTVGWKSFKDAYIAMLAAAPQEVQGE